MKPLGIDIKQVAAAMACVSLQGTFIEVNDAFCTLVGYTRAELLGRSFQDITYAEDHEISGSPLPQMLSGTLPLRTFEKRYVRKDKEIVWGKVMTTLLRYPSGDPHFFLSMIEDITRQKRAEEEHAQQLAQEQQAREHAQQQAMQLLSQLQAIFSSITENVVVFDLHGHLLHANEAAYKLLELSRDTSHTSNSLRQIMQRYDVRNEAGQKLSFEQIPMYRILQGETLSSSQPEEVVIHFADRVVYVSMSGAPVRDQEGNTIGGVCVFRDVTEQRQKERRVQQALNTILTLVEELVCIPKDAEQASQKGDTTFVSLSLGTVWQHLADLISQALDCQFVVLSSVEPETGKLTLVGATGVRPELLEVSRAEVNRSVVSDYNDERTMARLQNNEIVLRDMREEPLIGRSNFNMQKVLIAPIFIGEQLLGLCTIGNAPAHGTYSDEDIALIRAIAQLLSLVIERVRLLNEWAESQANELALQEVNRRFDDFISLASHELRVPLTAIKGNVQLALRRMENLKQQNGNEHDAALLNKLERIHEPLRHVIKRVDVQDRMISDLLDSSRIRAGKLEMVMQPCNLVEIVRLVVADQQQAAPDRTILLHISTPKYVPIVADVDRIEQVVQNYLANAIKYSPIDQPVEIALTSNETEARVEVRDQGAGLSDKEQAAIWERFYRAPGVTIQYGSGPGLGLGLYLCRTIIERHSGQVGVHSTPGVGSTFWFTLPLRTEHEAFNQQQSIEVSL